MGEIFLNCGWISYARTQMMVATVRTTQRCCAIVRKGDYNGVVAFTECIQLGKQTGDLNIGVFHEASKDFLEPGCKALLICAQLVPGLYTIIPRGETLIIRQ